MLLTITQQAATFLYVQISEYQLAGVYDAANDKSTFIKNLSFNTFLSTDTTKYCNFTYTPSTSGADTAYQLAPPAKPFYNSTCYDGATQNNIATTANFDQFLTFDSINIYYNNTLYLAINPTTASKYGVTPSDFFKGTSTEYPFSTASSFSTLMAAAPLTFSTIKKQLFIAKFQGDYSYLTFTVVDKAAGTTACTMMWTSLNETVCKLGSGSYILYGKDVKGKVMIKYPFTRGFYSAAEYLLMLALYQTGFAVTPCTTGPTCDAAGHLKITTYISAASTAAEKARAAQYTQAMQSSAYTALRAAVYAAPDKTTASTGADALVDAAETAIGAPTDAVSLAAGQEAIFRQLIPYYLAPISTVTTTGTTPTDFKSNPIQQTTFYIVMNDTSYKTAVDLNDQTCENVSTVITSNGTVIFNGYNQKYCYLAVTSSTLALIPWTDFIINASFSNGTNYIYTKSRLTPRMISDWAANSLNASTVVVPLSELAKTGLTGGEIAAIVIGSCAGAFFVALLAAILIRWCAFGCMTPAMVAAPKMMM